VQNAKDKSNFQRGTFNPNQCARKAIDARSTSFKDTALARITFDTCFTRILLTRD
jgi:hypothetical protein